MNKNFINVERLKLLTDGLIAIVMTLLVLELKVPHVNHISNTALLSHLSPLVPHLLAYIISFLLIAKYWQLHNFLFLNIRSMDGSLLWLNIFFLLTISFIPFPTELLSQYPSTNVAIIIFNISVVLPILFLGIISFYIARTEELLNELLAHTDMSHIKRFFRRLIGVPFIALIPTLICFFNTYFGISAWILIIFIIFDIFWQEKNKHHEF